MEPWRAPAVDRWALQLCNQRRVSPENFRVENGAVSLNADVFPRVLADWEEHWHLQHFPALIQQQVADYVSRLRELGESYKRLMRVLEQKEVHPLLRQAR
jgi:CRISPR/Cas system-associated endonuclease Cas1